MSNDSDRVHEPSPIRLLQAKEDGRVARSAELSRALSICLILSGVFIFAGTFQQIVGDHVRFAFTDVGVNLGQVNFSREQVLKVLFPFIFFVGTIAILGVLIWHIQSPISPRFHKAVPDITRLSIGDALAKVFSFDNLYKTLLLFVGLVFIGLIAFFVVRGRVTQITGLAGEDIHASTNTMGNFLKNFFVATGAVILVLGLVDYFRERIKLANQLRMTDQERRDEARDTEMNPQVRQRLIR